MHILETTCLFIILTGVFPSVFLYWTQRSRFSSKSAFLNSAELRKQICVFPASPYEINLVFSYKSY